MNIIIERAEEKPYRSSIDAIQDIVVKLITNPFFGWTMLVLLLTHKNWKRPIIILMVLHWILRSMGDMLESSMPLFPVKVEKWPFSNECFLYTYGVASICWYSSEIIGDWYLLLRTKALIKNHQKLRWIFFACLCYNIVKVGEMFIFLIYTPFSLGYNEDGYIDPTTFEDQYILDMANHKYIKWIDVALQQFCSLAYDIAVFMALKANIFNKLKTTNVQRGNDVGSKFVQNFKQISEYRIFLSIMVTIIGVPFIFGFCFKIIYLRNYAYHRFIDKEERIAYIGQNVNDMYIDPIRVCVLNFNYVFMYVDQILLRFYVDENNSSKKNSSNAISEFGSIPSSKNTYRYVMGTMINDFSNKNFN
eukprot:jgi/Orpsp1_1/1186588/evm.model.d7180000051695.1